MLGVAAAAFIGIFFFALPFPLIVAAAGVLGYFTTKDKVTTPAAGDPSAWRHATRALLVGLVLWLAPIALVVLAFGTGHVLFDIAAFFSKLAVVSFGGAYALLAYMAQQAVEAYG